MLPFIPKHGFGLILNTLIIMKNKKIYLLLLSFLITLLGFCQKIIVNNQESSGKLSWSDFTGKVDRSTSFQAFTSYKLKPKFGEIKVFGDSIKIGEFEIILELDQKKSWAKEDKLTDELLIHEQGHFNIGILNMKEILANYKLAKFTKSNFNPLIQNIITEASNKYREMGIKYDEETDHSKNKEQQLKWNNYFSEKLAL